MAGNKNSGPRPREIKATQNVDTIPLMGKTPEEIRRSMEWVWAEVLANRIDVKVAETAIKAGNLALRSIQARDSAEELERWERAVAEAKAIEAAGVARESADRLHANEDN